MSKTLTATKLNEVIVAEQISKKRDGSGHFIFREGYFYRHGNSLQRFADKIASQLNDQGFEFEIIDQGDHWTSFNGSASVANSSHFWVIASVSRK